MLHVVIIVSVQAREELVAGAAQGRHERKLRLLAVPEEADIQNTDVLP